MHRFGALQQVTAGIHQKQLRYCTDDQGYKVNLGVLHYNCPYTLFWSLLLNGALPGLNPILLDPLSFFLFFLFPPLLPLPLPALPRMVPFSTLGLPISGKPAATTPTPLPFNFPRALEDPLLLFPPVASLKKRAAFFSITDALRAHRCKCNKFLRVSSYCFLTTSNSFFASPYWVAKRCFASSTRFPSCCCIWYLASVAFNVNMVSDNRCSKWCMDMFFSSYSEFLLSSSLVNSSFNVSIVLTASDNNPCVFRNCPFKCTTFSSNFRVSSANTSACSRKAKTCLAESSWTFSSKAFTCSNSSRCSVAMERLRNQGETGEEQRHKQ
jgi:hypothetical protein